MRNFTAHSVHTVEGHLPTGKLTALGLQHVLVMYAGRALKLSPQPVATLISADLFCCGLVTLTRSLGATRFFGTKLPVMMGVTFTSVAPMVAMANSHPGLQGAGLRWTAALVESLPTFVLGGAGLVMFGMVAATGIRILATVD